MYLRISKHNQRDNRENFHFLESLPNDTYIPGSSSIPSILIPPPSSSSNFYKTSDVNSYKTSDSNNNIMVPLPMNPSSNLYKTNYVNSYNSIPISSNALYDLYNDSSLRSPTGDITNLINSPARVADTAASFREKQTSKDFCQSRNFAVGMFDKYGRPTNQNSINWGDCPGDNPMTAIDRYNRLQSMEFEYPDKYILTAPYGLLL